jgi:signal transduction histidine kinase
MKQKSILILIIQFFFFQILVFGFDDKKENALPVEVQQCIDKAMEYRLKDKTLASKALSSARGIAASKNDKKALFFIEKTAGYIFEDNNQLDSALVHYEKALSFAESINNEYLKATIFNEIAIANKRMGKYKIAKDYYQQSLRIAHQIKNLELEEFAYHGLGTLYEVLGDYEKAIESYWESIHLAEQRKSRSGVVNTMQNIAITYTKLQNHQTALETIEKAYQLSLEEKDTLLIGSVLFDYGKVLNSKNLPDEALLKFNQSLQLFQIANLKPLIARCFFYIADTYTSKGNYALAQSYFLQCAGYKDFISVKSYTELNAKLGALYLKQGRWHDAENAYLTSFKQADTYQLRDLKKESAMVLSEIYAQAKDFSQAYHYENIASLLRDSLYNEAQSKGITELQFKYDTEKSEKEIQTLRLRQTETFLIFGAILLLSVLAASLYVIRLRGINNKALFVKNAQIEDQNRLLLEKNAALEQFAYAAAHDLKEPLRNIGSFANLLQRRYKNQFDESAQEYMNFIVNGAKRMNDLLVGLLNFSALTNQRADNEDVKLGDVIDVVKANLKTALEEKQATINITTTLPSVPIHHLHLVQLFQNLISNALKFNDTKPIITLASKDSEKETLITVADNGIGMDKAYESKVFRLFHRLDRNKNYEGSGVGLSICKNIVEKYGGRIWYESEIGKGTTFFIAVPKPQVAIAA